MKRKKLPKWISPQKRMWKYKDFGITTFTLGKDKKWKKVRWTKYKIVVPTEEDRKQIVAAMEYFHDMREIDTDFIPVNQLVHEYDHYDESDKYSNIIVSKNDYHSLVFKHSRKKKK